MSTTPRSVKSPGRTGPPGLSYGTSLMSGDYDRTASRAQGATGLPTPPDWRFPILGAHEGAHTHNEEGPMGRLDGKVALISGGAKGQGAVEARMFVREGARVVFGDILDDDGKKVEAEVR